MDVLRLLGGGTVGGREEKRNGGRTGAGQVRGNEMGTFGKKGQQRPFLKTETASKGAGEHGSETSR